VVGFDEVRSNLSVGRFEVEAADHAGCSVIPLGVSGESRIPFASAVPPLFPGFQPGGDRCFNRRWIRIFG
jgi:hypothetical protein